MRPGHAEAETVRVADVDLAHLFTVTNAKSTSLKLGDGSFSLYLKSLKLGKMMKYEYVPEFQSALYAPKPLIDQ
ncbi:hypothetical protein [Janthinobacterium sp. JC611]|uniref:hypothetical protein n=1 Tax=Janthinobacterium sp. JC611 TaxID=2816201 RepID=UPI001BFDEF2A|nr:hypothetical protein [Janthinobacterium sp. JC611]